MKDIVIQDFWWEEEIDGLLEVYLHTQNASSADIKLFILKIINAERGNTYI